MTFLLLPREQLFYFVNQVKCAIKGYLAVGTITGKNPEI